MRKAVIEIRWEGPDKKVRDFIEDRVDGLFFDLTMELGDKILFADSRIEFTARVKEIS